MVTTGGPASRMTAVGEAPVLGMGNASGHVGALGHIRICDLSGQLAGAGATRVLAAFGAQVIRIEDPVTQRPVGHRPPDSVRTSTTTAAPTAASGFINHNVEKLGITLNLRTERGKELLAELVRVSNAVTENFAAGVMERLGFGYDRFASCAPTSCTSPTAGSVRPVRTGAFKSWGPIAQAVSGLTHTSGLPGHEPAGWGYSYMDHSGAYVMGIALLAALYHQRRTGEGQWVDVACIEGGHRHGRSGRARRHRQRATAARGGRHRLQPQPVPGDGPARHLPVPRRPTRWVALSPAATTTTGHALAEVIGEAWAKDDALDRAGRTTRRPGPPRRRAGGVDRPARPGRHRRRHPRRRHPASPRCSGRPSAATTTPRTRRGGCGRRPSTPSTARCGSTGCRCTCRAPTGTSSGPARYSGEDNEQVYAEVLGLTPAEIGRLADEGVI